MTRVACGALLFATGCTVDVTVGEACEPVVINEIMTSNKHWNDPRIGELTSDWFELKNTSTEADADLTGYVLVGSAVEYANCKAEGENAEEGEPFILSPGELVLYIATTYDVTVPEGTQTCFLDFNNDADHLELRASVHEVEACTDVDVPNQHVDYSWQPDPAETGAWCDASVSTPGEENEPCLCDVSDDC